jgi:hypothetical protein
MELTLKELQKNPELEMIFDEDLEKVVRIPYVIKNKILMSPGIWNSYYYKDATIRDAYTNTDWDSKEVVSLFLDHQDDRSSEWVGWVKNPKIDGNDVVGDLVVVDKATAIKLYAGAKFGISPKVRGQEENKEMKNFVFDNFSIVLNPAVKTAYINNSQEVEELEGFEEIRKSKNMSPAEFYAIPRDPPSESKLPIYDAAHCRNALARFNQVQDVSSDEKATAKRKIFTAAKKFGIEVSDEFKEMEENKMVEQEKEILAQTPAEIPAAVISNADALMNKMLEMLTEILAQLKNKEQVVEAPKNTENTEAIVAATETATEMSAKLSEQVVKLTTELKQVKAKLQEPAKMTLHAAAYSLREEDPDRGFLQLLKKGI